MSDHISLQHRCQRGEPSLASANNLLAECHAALGRLTAERDALQALLTAADEELDRAGGAYLNKNAECLKLRERADVLEGWLRRWSAEAGGVFCALKYETEAALKPAEPEPYQGIPGTSFQRLNALANQGE